MVQLKYTWLIESKILEIKASDMYGIFKVETENPILLKSDSAVSLSKDSVVTLSGNMKFRVSDSDNGDVRFYPMVVRNTPGTWEVRGTIANATALNISGYGKSWESNDFAGFWYDLKDNKKTENLTVIHFSGERNIAKGNLTYTTKTEPTLFKVFDEKNRTVQYGLNAAGTDIVNNGGSSYDVVGWMAEKYVAINGKPNKLAKIVYEQDTADKQTLTVGQTWEIGGGYTLTAQSIDARSTPRLAWFVLSKDGAKLDDKVIEAASTDSKNDGSTQGVYTYYANIGGESNVPIFVTYIDSVFSGATSDMVQLKYTWLIESKILEIKASDMYGILKVETENPILLKSDSAVSLSKDSVVTLSGNMKLRVSDSDNGDVRFYPMVEYTIGEGGAVTDGTAVATPKATVTAKANVTTTLTVAPTSVKPETTTAPAVAQTTAPTATPKEPGFEAVFAIAGLLAVAFLVLRQRK
jgi:S-layer protein (TIGR01567 family)